MHLVGKEPLEKSLCDLRKARDPCMSGSFIHNTWLTTIIAASGVQGGSLSGNGQKEVRIAAPCQRLLDVVLGNSLNNSHPPCGIEMKVVSLLYRGYSRAYLFMIVKCFSVVWKEAVGTDR